MKTFFYWMLVFPLRVLLKAWLITWKLVLQLTILLR
ncbi:hypothetical protein A5810_001524 [Enterococcus faecium]|uniref:Uncharacterized protein n=1 Tax=Enterococcus faecium TaxID=1352 RepID=A0A242BE68_ENTFC|nr:hypothetical protein A5810_001524 [Enterococcus faecium]